MAEEKPKYENPAMSRRVCVYPPPKYHNLVEAYSKANEVSESKVVSAAIKEFFDRMPESEKQRLINISKNSY